MVRNRTLRALRPLAPALAAALLGFAAPAAFADEDDLAPEEVQRVTQSLESKGYSNVHDLEADDGRYEADAVNAEGQKVDVELDPRTLEILHEKRD